MRGDKVVIKTNGCWWDKGKNLQKIVQVEDYNDNLEENLDDCVMYLISLEWEEVEQQQVYQL